MRKEFPAHLLEQSSRHLVSGTNSTLIRTTKCLRALVIRQRLFLDSLTLLETRNSTCSSTTTRANWNQSLEMMMRVVCTLQWPSWQKLDRTTTSTYPSSLHLVPARNSCSTSRVRFVMTSHPMITVQMQPHNWTT